MTVLNTRKAPEIIQHTQLLSKKFKINIFKTIQVFKCLRQAELGNFVKTQPQHTTEI